MESDIESLLSEILGYEGSIFFFEKKQENGWSTETH